MLVCREVVSRVLLDPAEELGVGRRCSSAEVHMARGSGSADGGQLVDLDDEDTAVAPTVQRDEEADVEEDAAIEVKAPVDAHVDG